MRLEELTDSLDNITEQRDAAIERSRLAQEARDREAQLIGSQNEERYKDVVDRFRNLFISLGCDIDSSTPITETPPIHIAQTDRGEITAVVQTLSYAETPYYTNRWNTKILMGDPEVLPHFADAENFKITYSLKVDNEDEKRVESFDAKRDHGDPDYPPNYPWTNPGGKWQHDEALRVKCMIDRMLPRANESLDMLEAAASSLNQV